MTALKRFEKPVDPVNVINALLEKARSKKRISNIPTRVSDIDEIVDILAAAVTGNFIKPREIQEEINYLSTQWRIAYEKKDRLLYKAIGNAVGILSSVANRLRGWNIRTY